MLGASQMGVTNSEKMNLQEEGPTNTIFKSYWDPGWMVGANFSS